MTEMLGYMTGLMLGAVCTFIIMDIREIIGRNFIWDYHEANGKRDEIIVCENATVVSDGEGFVWYDNEKLLSKIRNGRRH